MTDQSDPLVAVLAASKATTDADQQLHDAVTAARQAGVTWAAIGAVLGVTRQSVQKRFGSGISKDAPTS